MQPFKTTNCRAAVNINWVFDYDRLVSFQVIPLPQADLLSHLCTRHNARGKSWTPQGNKCALGIHMGTAPEPTYNHNYKIRRDFIFMLWTHFRLKSHGHSLSIRRDHIFQINDKYSANTWGKIFLWFFFRYVYTSLTKKRDQKGQNVLKDLICRVNWKREIKKIDKNSSYFNKW